MSLTVVIPVYNEEENLQPLARTLMEVLAGQPAFTILFVDDGSGDGSLALLKKMAAQDKHIAYLSLSRNFGHQAALRAGLEVAQGDCVVTMDGDFQHPPELIPSMIEAYRKGFDIVATRRLDAAPDGDKGLAPGKRLGSRLFYALMKVLGDVKIEPGSADFRLLSRRAVKALLSMPERTLFLRGAVPWIGFPSTELSYRPGNRRSGSSKYSFSAMFSFALDGITSFSVKPLRLASMFGCLISAAGFLYALYALIVRLFTDKTVEGWTSLLISVLIIGGIQLIFMGIIGEYLGKLFLEAKHRPHYLVKERSPGLPQDGGGIER
ncbi:MAG TPA: glycosyltransferase family 2 protein [Spirochaetales bacterium]|jgi:dolichol-phosphate mannosyltransferase|nr:Glycosyl transferase family 2 [uncultured Spirochaetota bacterium]HOI22243.1 glycosyltransferase family 2 protein [Spirochaetales bacterium]